MINFRYHIVSLAAVLLALAAGVALGAGLLDDAGESSSNDNQQGSSDISTTLAAFDAAYTARTSDGVLANRLAGQRVVIMTTPGFRDAEASGLSDDIKAAGGTVVGQVALTDKLLDPAQRQFAQSVASSAAGDAATGDDAYAKIGSALGRAYVSATSDTADQTATTIRSAFTEGGLVATTADPSALATVALVLTGPATSSSSDEGTVLGQLLPAFDAAGKGTLVAGPVSSGTALGVVGKVRDSDAATKVSTFDVTDLASGRVGAILALSQEASGNTGSWGTTRSADGALPQ